MRSAYNPTIGGYPLEDIYIPMRIGKYTPYGYDFNVRPVLNSDIPCLASDYVAPIETSVKNSKNVLIDILFYFRFESVFSRLF